MSRPGIEAALHPDRGLRGRELVLQGRCPGVRLHGGLSARTSYLKFEEIICIYNLTKIERIVFWFYLI